MAKRAIGQFQVEAVGYGAMPLSHGYGARPAEADSERLLHAALDMGYDFIDTAALYGMGHNETLIGRALKSRRDEFVLASKCGFRMGEGVRSVDGSPAGIRATLDGSLQRLGLDVIDLYYLHRVDPAVPIEDSVGALADAVQAGKIRAIGLSEASAETLRRASAVHPIAALQTEYSLWTRNPEIAVLAACRELGTTFVSFSPVGRGFLTDVDLDPGALAEGDIRRVMPRFLGADWARNEALLPAFRALAREQGCTAAQLALAWVLARDETMVTIPGTTSQTHLADNFAARAIALSAETMAALDAIINRETVSGPRYTPLMQAMIDTEEFAAA